MPTKREQADAIAALVRESVATVDAIAPGALRAVIPALTAARKELQHDLHDWLGSVDYGEKYTTFKNAQALRSIEATLAQLKAAQPAVAAGLRIGREATGVLAVENLDKEVSKLGSIFGDTMMPPQIDTAAVIAQGKSLMWKRHATSAKRYAGELGDDLKHQFAVGLAKGETIGQVVNRLRKMSGFVKMATGIDAGTQATEISDSFFWRWRYKADRLVRTEVMTAYNVQHHAAIIQLDSERPDDEDPWLERWDASADLVTCELCRGLHDRVKPLGGTFRYAGVDIVQPPAHPHCFLPGTRVGARVQAATRSNYAGDAVEINTAAGRRLRVTVNHPIATTRGFVAAATIRKGDKVLSQLGGIWNARPRSGSLAQVDENHQPPTIDEIYSALAMQGPALRSALTDEDLHGDAARCDGHIDVVLALCELERGTRPERSSDLLLPSANAGESGHAGLSGGDFALTGDRCSAHRIVGSGDLKDSLLGRHSGPFGRLTLGLPAQGNAASDEPRTESASSDPGLVGQLLERFSGEIALDEVVEVRHFQFSGHVYDLQTSTGWLVAEGIYSSNCRCILLAWLARWGGIKGEVPAKGRLARPRPKQVEDTAAYQKERARTRAASADAKKVAAEDLAAFEAHKVAQAKLAAEAQAKAYAAKLQLEQAAAAKKQADQAQKQAKAVAAKIKKIEKLKATAAPFSAETSGTLGYIPAGKMKGKAKILQKPGMVLVDANTIIGHGYEVKWIPTSGSWVTTKGPHEAGMKFDYNANKWTPKGPTIGQAAAAMPAPVMPHGQAAPWSPSNVTPLPHSTYKQATVEDHRALTPTERNSVLAYSGSSYTPINEGLRGIRGRTVSSESQRHIDQLDAALKNPAARMRQDAILYRGQGGLDYFSKKNVGDEFDDKGFVSTSQYTGNAFYQSGTVRFHITVPKGHPAIAMGSDLSHYSNEREILLPRGSRFRVVHKETIAGRLYLHVEVLPHAP